MRPRLEPIVSNSQYRTFLVFDTLVDTPAMGALNVALILELNFERKQWQLQMLRLELELRLYKL